MLRALVVLIVIVSAAAGALIYSVVSRGLSAHDEPSAVEALLAGAMRRWATPQAVRARTNSVPATQAVLAEALEHWAGHCATCHANDGSGDTEIGRGLYPRAPDMRARDTSADRRRALLDHRARHPPHGYARMGNGDGRGRARELGSRALRATLADADPGGDRAHGGAESEDSGAVAGGRGCSSLPGGWHDPAGAGRAWGTPLNP